MVSFVFTKYAEKQFRKLPMSVRNRIISKLKLLKEHPDIFSVVKVLNDLVPATHRLRVGSYRLILELKQQKKEQVVFWILKAQHRRDVYK